MGADDDDFDYFKAPPSVKNDPDSKPVNLGGGLLNGGPPNGFYTGYEGDRPISCFTSLKLKFKNARLKKKSHEKVARDEYMDDDDDDRDLE